MGIRTPTTRLDLIQRWIVRIATALADQRPESARGLSVEELRGVTGLTSAEVCYGCWHGRLQGLFEYEGLTGTSRYRLTRLGRALVQRQQSQAQR